jgi:hypothetical protein
MIKELITKIDNNKESVNEQLAPLFSQNQEER